MQNDLSFTSVKNTITKQRCMHTTPPAGAKVHATVTLPPTQVTKITRGGYMIKLGLIGYGRAGKAVASVLAADPEIDLCWIARQHIQPDLSAPALQVAAHSPSDFARLFDRHPVDAIIDFSRPDSITRYGTEAAQRQIAILSANSGHSDEQQALARRLGERTAVMCSPNITLGINFLLIAAKGLKKIAPDVDVAIIEEHFRQKPEVSGTAKKIATALDVNADNITSLRLGGVVGHHQVIFGFPHQTVRFIHDSISCEAFGTGAIFAAKLLLKQSAGFYSLEKLLMHEVLTALSEDQQQVA
jgi:4-hydroxy-tetrahydrodipicolinate reductase